jgi:hypothetical protein
MIEPIAGRKEEVSTLAALKTSNRSAFVALYGRRRIGKTYLIRNVYEDDFSFQVTGLAKADTNGQLANFYVALLKYFPGLEGKSSPQNWFESFLLLSKCLEESSFERKIVFLDELPWFDTAKSGFISALEHFWNSWASARRDVVLIVCGSAASWMVNNLINDHGGLHNRVTHRMRLHPFTLTECEEFFRLRSISFDRYQLVQLYMVLGGVPFYLDQVKGGQSAAQNIENLCFTEDGVLRKEFDNLYPSLFKKPGKHIAIIEALAQKSKGLTRLELLESTRLPDGGSTTRLLKELEESSFIRRYSPFGGKENNAIYQLCDFYSLFYIRFIRHASVDDQDLWITSLDHPSIRAWSGYAFEQVCLAHIPAIKKALGIQGVRTQTSAWIGGDERSKAQIDLVIDRRDHVINLCEMKFSLDAYKIDKDYAASLRRKVAVFREQTGTKKSLFLTMITTFGVENNEYKGSVVQNDLKMDVLFE